MEGCVASHLVQILLKMMVNRKIAPVDSAVNMINRGEKPGIIVWWTNLSIKKVKGGSALLFST